MSLDLSSLMWITKARESLQLHIMAGARPTLGRDWLHKLKLNCPAICYLSSSSTLESVLDMHNVVFNEELGCVQGMSRSFLGLVNYYAKFMPNPVLSRVAERVLSGWSNIRSRQLLLHSTCGNGQPIPGSVST